ncbi:MAG: hypothetical protein A3K68_01060 [Euryarchaeota archaeon RBG_16_68_13]|nr:MAG: hypothetical protein A3K68_01060 [Euryarchaeota archaeon RBG_16_68_13]
MRRIKHRDAVALSVLSASYLLAGEMANPVLLRIYEEYLVPVLDEPALLVLYAALAVLAFTTAFGAVLVLLGGWYFLQGRISRGRFLVGMGVGLTSLSLLSRLAYHVLVTGSPVPFLLYLTTTLTGLGVLFGVLSHVVMGQYALLLKKHARAAWRRWRRSRRPSRRASRT